jgi:predicted amidohydrolase
MKQKTGGKSNAICFFTIFVKGGDWRMSAQFFKAASIEFNPCLNELDRNMEALLAAVTEAAENGAKLIVTPEMATTGYHYGSRSAIRPFVDTIPGKTTMAFEAAAKRYQTHIVIGMAEVDEEDGLYYNSCALIGPDGYIGKYRKTHQWAAEDGWASWGDLGIPVYETAIGNIAMIICMDSTYFEPARLAAVNGADLLCFPTNSTGGSLSMLQGWAEMNGLYIVGANRSNTEEEYQMIGASAIWSPAGQKLGETSYVEEAQAANEVSILYAEIDRAQYDNAAKRRLKERKTDVYHELLLYDGPWEYARWANTGGPRQKTAALLQYTPEIAGQEANLSKIKSLLAEAVHTAGKKECVLSLAVCPELSLTGPVETLSSEEVEKLAETMEGETVAEMKALAEKYGIHLVFGMIERAGPKLYNTVCLLSPTGLIAAKARKIHLTESDKRWAHAGEDIAVTHVDTIGRVGMMVGYDAAFPETAGVMAVKHAEIILIPSSWHGEFGGTLSLHEKMMEQKFPENAMITWDVTARFSQTNVLAANFVGTSLGCKGGSALYTPDPIYGGALPEAASSVGEEVLLVTIPVNRPDWWLTQEKLLLSRRIHHYRPLVMKNAASAFRPAESHKLFYVNESKSLTS